MGEEKTSSAYIRELITQRINSLFIEGGREANILSYIERSVRDTVHGYVQKCVKEAVGADGFRTEDSVLSGSVKAMATALAKEHLEKEVAGFALTPSEIKAVVCNLRNLFLTEFQTRMRRLTEEAARDAVSKLVLEQVQALLPEAEQAVRERVERDRKVPL